MANLDILIARKAALYAKLNALDNPQGAASGNPGSLPNASGPGVNVDHVGYRKSILEEIDWIDRKIGVEGAPWTVETVGET